MGISLGDPGGIGPEVTLKALAQLPADEWKFLLLGDSRLITTLNQKIGLDLPLAEFRSYQENGRIFVLNPGEPLAPEIVQGAAPSARAALSYLEEGARRCLRGELSALVTAPVNKEAIIRLGKPFTGQTEFLAGLSHASEIAMMLLGHDEKNRWLRVALVTTHLPIRDVADAITEQGVGITIRLAAQACRDLGLPRARIAVCGLNPHAGEGGEIGREEIDLIAPAIGRTRESGINVEGPIPADTLFYYAYQGRYDAVVAMYHDQGLAPLKMIGFESGINWTLGLPFIRTSPDHGTAYNIAGQNKANPSSMIAAIQLAQKLAVESKKAALPAQSGSFPH
jgi:4-hydroxythreonine-4-phosphate dehydrogenase